MPVPKHLEEAAGRLEAIERTLRLKGEPPGTLEGLREWVQALTEFAFALSEVQRYANESVHEKLHELARHARVGLS